MRAVGKVSECRSKGRDNLASHSNNPVDLLLGRRMSEIPDSALQLRPAEHCRHRHFDQKSTTIERPPITGLCAYFVIQTFDTAKNRQAGPRD